MRVVIAGGTGLVGRGLVGRLLAEGHEVTVLTRDLTRAEQRYHAVTPRNRLRLARYVPVRPGPWQHSIAGCDALINLAGEPLLSGALGGRWTAERRAAILKSRVLTTRHLAEAAVHAEPRPSVMLSASAIGYYGASETEVFVEESPPGRNFLARVCQAWEQEAQAVVAAGIRLVVLRMGLVLAADHPLMQSPFQSLAGGAVGSGHQWVSWIHRDDLVRLGLTALTRDDIAGVLNATAPHPVRMQEFSETLARLRSARSRWGVPSALVRAVLGDAAGVLLEGQRVMPARAQALGFRFHYPTLDAALRAILAPGL